MLPRTLPRSVIEDPGKRAEVRIFSELQKDKGLHDWLCFHSLNLETPCTTRCGEIDFVVLNQDGIFCLEVKGGGIRCLGGQWTSIDYNGAEHKVKDPFSQAEQSMYTVKGYVEEQIRGIKDRVLFGYGVAFPNCPFENVSIEHPGEIIYDLNDAGNPISEYLNRVTGYFKNKYSTLKVAVKKDIRARIKNILRPDFEIFEPLGHIIESIEEEIESLTQEQYSLFDSMVVNPRMIIKGQAGTGKTLLARHHAKNLAREGKRVLFLCYNVFLAEALRAEIAREGLDDMVHVDRVLNYFRSVIDESEYKDEFAAEFEKYEEERKNKEVATELLPLYFTMAVEKLNPDKFDCLIIDEGQDMLCENILDAISLMLKGGLKDGSWYIFYDPDCQMLYSYYDEEYCKQVKKTIRPTLFELTVNCRNTKQIVDATSAITGFEMSESRIHQGKDVESIYYNDMDEMKLKLSQYIKKLLKNGIRHEEICILYPGGDKHAELSGSLQDLPGINTQPITEKNVGLPIAKTVKTCSIQKFKGLERKVIIVLFPEFEDMSNINQWMRTVLGVGFTRAKALLCLCANTRLKKEIEKIRRAKAG